MARPLAQGNNTQGNPRVIDGIIVLDRSGRVVVASPNANSMYNRMGMTGYLEKQNRCRRHPCDASCR